MVTDEPIVKTVTRRADSAAAAPAPDSNRVEDIEASLLPQSRRLARQFSVDGLDRKYLQHLEQKIQRNPRDLRSHVQRVLMLHALRDAPGVNGALIDLYLALGPNGMALRQRLLEGTADQLASTQLEFLSRHLETGLSGSEVIPDVSRSCLSKQVRGTTAIVARKISGDAQTTDIVSLARESMANGQIKSAQLLLEGALETDPGRADVCTLLLNLYQSENLPADFRKTYTALLGRELACADQWHDTAAHFDATGHGDDDR